MEFIPEPARFKQAEPIARRNDAATLCAGMHARFETLPSVDGLLPERHRLQLRPASLSVTAACLASTLAEGCTIVVEESGAVRVLDDRTLATLVRQGSLRARAALRLAAQAACVDQSDLFAVARALRLEQDLLDADVRALWSLQAIDEELVLQSLDPTAPLCLLSEAITGYTQARLGGQRLPRLPRRFARELLDAVTVEILPVDTQVWSGFVEIGVRLGAGSSSRDCERTVLFDRPSATWHLGE
ncbi:MAG: hypothetical protein LW625_07370 [Planctomycetaceae bacterium]|nr:hypothetical protein [Planctomycetaceae bacterium]